jgi:hypothetical protein
MMSKASVDLPEPETPVTTLRAWCGSERVRFLRLFSRAPMRWRAGGVRGAEGVRE